MIRIFRDDAKWAIAGKVATNVLEQLARKLPRELQGEGSKVVPGKQGFAALLVFGDLDFDDDAPVTLKLDRKKTRVTETRVDEHPADFLEGYGIVAPGYAATPSPVKSVGIVEGASLAEAKRSLPPDADVRVTEHPRGVLFDYAMAAGMLADELGKRGFLVFRDPEAKDGWFCCVVHEPGKEPASYSPVRRDPNSLPLDNVLGETTLEGIVRVLEIPGKLLGL